MSTFPTSNASITGYAEILPDRIRTLNRGNPIPGVSGGGSGFMHASFEDTYTVGGTAAGPFDISVALHVTGVAKSNGVNCPSAICHQLVVASAQAEIGVFQTFTDGALGENLRVQPFNAQSSALASFPTEGAGAPFERPIDITANYTVLNVNVGDTFVLAYGMNSSFGRGEIDLLEGGVISFDLPEGVFLTSALAESLLPQPGDHNLDGIVDAADYVAWRKTDSGNPQGYIDWVANFGEGMGGGGSAGASLSQTGVPEPATLVLLMFAATGWCLRRGHAMRIEPL
jgi:hypothetical protein